MTGNGNFIKRRAQELQYGSSRGILPGSPLSSFAPGAVYGVEDGDRPYSVRIRMGEATLDLEREPALALGLLVLKRAVGDATVPREMRDGVISIALLMLRSAGVEVDLGQEPTS